MIKSYIIKKHESALNKGKKIKYVSTLDIISYKKNKNYYLINFITEFIQTETQQNCCG